MTASLPRPDGTALISEGSALLHLDPRGETPRVLTRVDLGRGAILDLQAGSTFDYALTETGLMVLQAGSVDAPVVVVSWLPGGGQAFAVRGDLVAVAARRAGVRLMQIDGDGSGQVLPTPILPGEALDVAFDPERPVLYVAGGEAGVHVLRLDDLSGPVLSGTLPGTAPAQSVAVVGKLLAVGSGPRMLIVDPAAVSAGPLSVYAPLHDGRRMVARDGYIFVADAADGLKIFWLAAPDRPVMVYGEVDRPAYDIQLEGNTVYLAGVDGLRVVDVSSRYRPLELGHIALPGQPEGLHVADRRAFVALGRDGVAVLDVSSPAMMRLLRRISLEPAVPGGEAHAITYSAGVAYVAAGDAGLVLIDAAQAGGETLAGAIALAGPALDIARRGTALFVAAGEAGLATLDISSPRRPALIATLPPPAGERSSSLFITGRRAYVSHDGSLSVVDIGRPSQMGVLARVRGAARHAGQDGVYLYVVAGNSITAYDARANAEPIYLRTYRGLRQVGAIHAGEERAYLTGPGEGPDLVVVGLSTPGYPFELDSVGQTGSGQHVTLYGGEIWLARGYGGLSRYTQTEGGALRPLNAVPAVSSLSLLASDGDALLAGGRDGWLLLDSRGTRLGPAGEPSLLRGLALEGDRAALALGDAGLALFDTGGAGLPTLIAQRHMGGEILDVALDTDFVYAAGSTGLTVYDRSYLQPLVQVPTPGVATGIALHRGMAYLSLADGSLATIELGDLPGGLRVLGSITTGQPYDLVAGSSDGETYGLANDQIMRLQAGSSGGLLLIDRAGLRVTADQMVLQDGLLIAATSGDALRVYQPAFLSTNNIPRREIGLPNTFELTGPPVLQGQFAYLPQGEAGLALLDTASPGVGATFFDETVNALYDMGGGLLAALGERLTLWDTTHPEQPQQVASLSLPAPGSSITATAAGDLLLGLDSGLAVIRLQGRTPALIGHLSTPGPVHDAAQIGGRAYLALQTGGLHVADLSDPAYPVSLFSYVSPLGQFAASLLALEDNTLLVSWETGIERLAAETGSRPPRLLNVAEAGALQAEGIVLAPDGTRGALLLGSEGVALFELEEGSAAHFVGYIESLDRARGAALDGNILYVADGECGLRVYDITNPAERQEVGYWRTDYASDVVLGRDREGDALIYLADAGSLLTLRYDPALPPVMPPLPHQPYPADGAGEVPLDPVLGWGPAPDPCQPLTYDVYLGTGPTPAPVGRVSSEPELAISRLQARRGYYWQVEVTDRQGDRSIGPLWQFTTAAGDLPDPFPPAPPLFRDRLRQAPWLGALLLGGILALMLATLYLSRRRAGRSKGGPPIA
ncbi:MAG: hypothetical protein Kow00124_02020 [Anaerolineae bacterium]